MMCAQVPWVLLENVVGLLDRVNGAPPAMDYVVTQLEALSYRWAYRVVNTVSSPIIT
jgi:site-specific DNA-cytosine methylase